MNKVRFTKLECLVMEVLWRHGPSSLYEIRSLMPDTPYSTIHMVVRRLERKRAVSRGERCTVEPAITRTAACESFLDGSLGHTNEITVRLMTYFLEAGRLTLADVHDGVVLTAAKRRPDSTR